MTKKKTASQQITDEVTSWPGVQAGPGRRGEFSFKVGRREIGHLHGDRAAHFGFPKETGTTLREEGRVGPHPVNPKSTKLASRRIRDESDIQEVIKLMRLNYDRIVDRHGLPVYSGRKNDNPRIHIDKFTVSEQGIEEFTKRLQQNPNIIKKLPGFINHEVYQRTDETGNLICITVAEWESAEALENARKIVKAKYKEENFDPAEMFKRLGITAERDVYSRLDDVIQTDKSWNHGDQPKNA